MEQTAQLAPRMRRTLLGTVPITSPLYALHPVTRLCTLLVFSVISLFIDLPEINIAILIFIILYMKWAKVDISGLKIYMPLVFTVAFFMFSVSILAPTKDPSYHTFRFLGMTFYLESLYWTFASYIRLMAMLFGTIQYFSTNRERETLVAIRSLKVPFAVTYFLTLALRAAGMFMEDLRTIREAERARGLDESSLSLGDRAKLYAMYMIPLFTLAIRRTDEISNALHARGYTISGKMITGEKRSDYILTKYAFNRIDLVLIIVMLAIFVAVAVMRIGFGVFVVTQSPFRQFLIQLLSGS